MSNNLNLFPARVPIGVVQPDGTVLMMPEFVRAMRALFERVGGAAGMGADDLAILTSSMAQIDHMQSQAIEDIGAVMAPDWSGRIGELLAEVEDLRRQVTQFERLHAELAEVRKALEDVEAQAIYRDPGRTDWERPGQIGSLTANSGAFTTVQSSGGAGFNGAPPQTAAASGGALAAYGAGANGLDTAAHMSALHALVVSIRAALVANGIMS